MLGAHVCGNVFLNEQLKEFNRVSVFFILGTSTVNVIATNTLEKRFDEAVHVYVPESSGLGFQIFGVASAPTADRLPGIVPLIFFQVTVGCGSPAAWQRTVIFCIVLTLRCAGGFTIKWGLWTTLRSVTAESCPRGFDAWHLYKPESLFWAFNIDSCPSLTTALACTRLLGSLRHVIFGGGNPVTWHTGKVMFFPFST